MGIGFMSRFCRVDRFSPKALWPSSCVVFNMGDIWGLGPTTGLIGSQVLLVREIYKTLRPRGRDVGLIEDTRLHKYYSYYRNLRLRVKV